MRWLKDDEEGYEGGAKIADTHLENRLLEVIAECEEGNLQVLPELLMTEAVMFRPTWCGGAADRPM